MFTLKFDTSIDIAATRDQVWAVLTDFANYGQWNPFMVSAVGAAVAGTRMTNTISDASGSKMTFRPTITKAEPGRELRWMGRLGMPGVFDGEHWFTIEPLSTGGSRLRQGENFSGLLVPLLTGKLRRGTLPQFHAMNAALANRIGAEQAPGLMLDR
jgi:hypothetical protein